MDPVPVKLGDRTYNLVPQKIGRIRRKFGAAFGLIEAGATGDAPAQVDDQLYEGLRVFIPDLAPKWELMGYADAELNEPTDELADKSPTPNEIADAIEAIFNLHGGDRFVRLGKNFISPTVIRAWIDKELVGRLSASEHLRNLRAQRDGSETSMPSTTTDPTANGRQGSPLSV